jgi:hypothetical protein
VTRLELILRLNEVEEVFHDYRGLSLSVMSIDEVHFRVIVPKIAYSLIVIIRRRYIYEIVRNARYRLVCGRCFYRTSRD